MKNLEFGIQSNGIKHRHIDPIPDIDTRFAMVREAGVFDYVDKTPEPDEVDQFLAASEKYNLPVYGGGWFYVVDRDEDLLAHNLAIGHRLGSRVHNVQVLATRADGQAVSNDDVVGFYERGLEIGQRLGVLPCLEVHVNMWSEDFRRVAEVAALAMARGLPFHMTLDHSHVIFKIDHPAEQDVSGIREDVAAGRLILDPFQAGHVSGHWIDANAHAADVDDGSARRVGLGRGLAGAFGWPRVARGREAQAGIRAHQ